MQNSTSILDPSVEPTPEKVTLGFHVGAIFIVLVVSFLGVVAPSCLIRKKLLTVNDGKFQIGKAFSAGVILGVGFIHMLPEAQNKLNESLPDYPFSGLLAGIAAMFSLLIEQIAFQQIKSLMQRKSSSPQDPCPKEMMQEMVHLHIDNKKPSNITSDIRPISENIKGTENGMCEKKECLDCANPAYRTEEEYVQSRKKEAQNHEDDANEHAGHSHGVINIYTDEELLSKVNSFTIAHVLEIGVAFHSILIGIALSVENNYAHFEVLLIAICFHQFFEGFALGSSIQGAKITSLLHLGIMTLIFSFSTPIGQSIGIGVSSLYEEDSSVAQQTEGIFDSISGGILIYMALVDFIGEDFRKNYRGRMRYWMVLSVFVGNGFMAILAMWA